MPPASWLPCTFTDDSADSLSSSLLVSSSDSSSDSSSSSDEDVTVDVPSLELVTAESSLSEDPREVGLPAATPLLPTAADATACTPLTLVRAGAAAAAAAALARDAMGCCTRVGGWAAAEGVLRSSPSSCTSTKVAMGEGASSVPGTCLLCRAGEARAEAGERLEGRPMARWTLATTL